MPEMLSQFDGKRADPVARVPDFVYQVRPARQINDGAGQRLVHRRISRAITHDAFFIAQSGGEGLTQTDRRILDRMVVVNVQIAFTSDFEVEESVTRKEFEHVIEKWNAGRNGVFAFAVDIERDADVCFFGRAFD